MRLVYSFLPSTSERYVIWVDFHPVLVKIAGLHKFTDINILPSERTATYPRAAMQKAIPHLHAASAHFSPSGKFT